MLAKRSVHVELSIVMGAPHWMVDSMENPSPLDDENRGTPMTRKAPCSWNPPLRGAISMWPPHLSRRCCSAGFCPCACPRLLWNGESWDVFRWTFGSSVGVEVSSRNLLQLLMEKGPFMDDLQWLTNYSLQTIKLAVMCCFCKTAGPLASGTITSW